MISVNVVFVGVVLVLVVVLQWCVLFESFLCVWLPFLLRFLKLLVGTLCSPLGLFLYLGYSQGCLLEGSYGHRGLVALCCPLIVSIVLRLCLPKSHVCILFVVVFYYFPYFFFCYLERH